MLDSPCVTRHLSRCVHSAQGCRVLPFVAIGLCRRVGVVQLLLGSSMVTEIVSQALETVKFNSFIALRRLYERGFTLDSRWFRFISLLCVVFVSPCLSVCDARIRDAASFGFENMFGPVDVNAPDVIPTRHNEVVSGAGGAAAPVSAEPVLSPQEAARLEMAQMLVMVYGMFDVDDCVIALKRNNDDPDRAANWLMDDSSQRVLRAERVPLLCVLLPKLPSRLRHGWLLFRGVCPGRKSEQSWERRHCSEQVILRPEGLCQTAESSGVIWDLWSAC